ncbi:MAG: Isochorismate synthase DhbC [Paracidovorax wautersii]|uniref:isochorismate synthase n=1 Tax=Paracidovorax wautersii TaxID=1177982 RepID=A0A7V8FLL2_9BURK|nr:MAG: Isochorismate synthase DhbC [Paracidovorax wautersii]
MLYESSLTDPAIAGPDRGTGSRPARAGEPAAPALPAFAQLLDRYQPGDDLFASPRGTWLGQGVVAALPADTPPAATHALGAQRLRDQVAELLQQATRAQQGEQALVMGAVPFDLRQPAALRAPQRLTRGAAPQAAAQPAAVGAIRPVAARPEPAPAVYEAAVDAALARFAEGSLDKVVLSRTLALELPTAPDSRELLRRLAALNTRGYTYAVPLEAVGDQPAGAFLGGTPELLVRRIGRHVYVNPLAGSTPRGRSADEDTRLSQTLLQSPKDRHEHAVVIDAVVRALRPLCRSLDVPAGPSLVSTDALWHLSTVLQGELVDEATTSLDLALALHPTPAVCGHPTARAFEAIGELEPFERGLFAGFVGWCDARGDGEWAVTLRCAEVRGSAVRLYAGAGVVAGSVPASETAETQTKFSTMLRALGIAPDAL